MTCSVPELVLLLGLNPELSIKGKMDKKYNKYEYTYTILNKSKQQLVKLWHLWKINLFQGAAT